VRFKRQKWLRSLKEVSPSRAVTTAGEVAWFARLQNVVVVSQTAEIVAPLAGGNRFVRLGWSGGETTALPRCWRLAPPSSGVLLLSPSLALAADGGSAEPPSIDEEPAGVASEAEEASFALVNIPTSRLLLRCFDGR
jgi:hypothetical protein